MNKRLYILVIILLYFISNIQLFAQKEYYNWIFGRGSYITFDTPNRSPQIVEPSNIDTWEGCTSVSDKDGKLLFYSNGESVMNKNHLKMPNGTGLTGHNSSLQSGIAFKVPDTDDKYYLFTVEAIERRQTGLCYNIIDMSLFGGLGDIDISTKNRLIDDDCIERATAIYHSNNEDMWVLSHRYSANEYVAYLVTKSGVNFTPVISKVSYGASHPNWDCAIKPSNDGKLVVSADMQTKNIEIFDFDRTTGKLSSRNKIAFEGYTWAYNFEFSPDAKKLYVTTFYPCQVLQYDLSSGDDVEIAKSKVILEANKGKVFYFGGLQRAPNDKIYVARDGDQHLGVINKPNAKGTACDYQPYGFSLGASMYSRLGLPNFMQINQYCSLENDKIVDYELFDSEKNNFDTDYNRKFNSNQFIDNPNSMYVSNLNPFNNADPCIIFNGNTSYIYFHTNKEQKTLISYEMNAVPNEVYNLSFDIVKLEEKPFDNINIYINGEQIFYERFFNNGNCVLDSIKYNFINGNNSKIKIEITYNSNTEDFFGIGNFKFRVCSCDNLSSLSRTLRLCKKEAVELSGRVDSVFLNRWYPSEKFTNPNASKQIYNPSKSDTIYLRSQNIFSNCLYFDTIYIDIMPTQDLTIKGSNIICENDTNFIYVDDTFDEYNWSNGAKTNGIYVTETGEYELICYDINGCEFKGIFSVEKGKSIDNQIIATRVDCNTKEYILSLKNKANSYKWSNGQTTEMIKVNEAGRYIVECTYGDGYCSTIDTIDVSFDVNDFSILQDAIKDTLCLSEIIKLYPDRDFKSYNWYNKGLNKKVSEEKEYYVKENGEYYLVVIDDNGCEFTSKIVVVSSIYDMGGGRSLKFILNRDSLHYIDSTEYMTQRCSTISVYNTSDEDIVINDVYLYKNTSFSTPLSQFSITIPAYDTVDLQVCFQPFKMGENRDTIRIGNDCYQDNIPLLSYGILSSSNSGSKCDVTILLSDPDSKGGTSATFYNPTPNPASDFISINYEIDGKSDTNIEIHSYIIDILGNKWSKSEISSQISANNNGSIDFNIEKLTTGYYLIIIEIENQIASFPILINK